MGEIIGGNEGRDPLVHGMMEKLRPYDGMGVQMDEPFSICRVPPHIRRVDASAYEPEVVSIGPYHRGSPNLCDMEDLKWRYMHNLLLRKSQRDFMTEVLQQCIEKVKQSEAQARRCYKVPFDTSTTSDDFVMMLVLDGCFILELLLGPYYGIAEKDPIYAVAWIINSIWRDLLKLENQIPFFILKDLFSIVAPEPNKFNNIKTPFPEEVIRHLKSISAEQEVYHLLHLHHKLLKPAAKVTDTTSASKPSHDSPPIMFKMNVNQYLLPRMRILTSTKYTADTTSSRINNPSNYSSSVKSKICNRIKKLYLISSPEVAQGHNSMIPCIVELGDAGIKFRRQPKASSPLDVAFKDGILHIPPLTIQDNTNSVFRNLTAFEQCCPNTGRYFSIYITFLDCLINTAKDVAILQQCSIIDNMLGSEEEVAQLINQLGKDLTLDLDSRHHYLAQVFAEVNGHCESKWHKYRATCMRDYFSTPWSMLSLLAAIALLFMTLIQVVYAVLSYKKP